jgi:hypothetical protein
MANFTKNSKNEELYKGLTPEVLGNGRTHIFAIEPTANENYKTIFLCQEVKAGSGSDSAQKFFLGWKDTRLIRAIHNAEAKIAANFKVGQTVPFDILLEEKITPAYDGQEPKINPTTSEVIMFNGSRVYEHGSLVAQGKGGIKRLEDQRASIITTQENPVVTKESVTV